MAETRGTVKKDPFLELAVNCYSQSTTFTDANYRKKWNNNIRHFHSKHHAGSKYLKDAYKYRSKFFRPKTRATIRNNEAAASAAFFSNQDVVSIDPLDPNDPIQQAAADLQQELLQYRLTETIPWFLVCIGGFQDAQKVGVVVSFQDWDYEERATKGYAPQLDQAGRPVIDEGGQPVMVQAETVEVVKDKPYIIILPIENVRIHPAADWMDPINSSPYVIRLIPMYVQDVKARMNKKNPKTGAAKWKQLTDGELASGRRHRFDSTRMEREDNREDKYSKDQPAMEGEISEFDIVWVHQNFMRLAGEEIVFYTLGTEHLLTDPVFLEEEFPHCQNGERPLVMGTAVLETHKIYPPGVGELGEGIQKEINENANQTSDAGKFALNKRWFVKRGAQVDLKSINRNVPGSSTLMNDPLKDVVGQEFNDIPASAYAQQDRLNLDYDDVTGTFSPGSIQSNRKLNETVGGMGMMRAGTQSLTEYTIRTFGETWAEKVLKQLINMEREYETDEVVLALAAHKAKLFQKYNIDPNNPEILAQLLTQNLQTTVNLGLGATDPVGRVNHFMMGNKAVAEIVKVNQDGTFNVPEIAKEIYGRLGYKDGSRFVNGEDGQDPEKVKMMQTIEELGRQLEGKENENRAKIVLQQMKEEGLDRRQLRDLIAELLMDDFGLSEAKQITDGSRT